MTLEQRADRLMQIAESRGHEMRPWRKFRYGEQGESWRTSCRKRECGCNLYVSTLREGDEGGLALEYDCAPGELPF